LAARQRHAPDELDADAVDPDEIGALLAALEAALPGDPPTAEGAEAPAPARGADRAAPPEGGASARGPVTELDLP
ncbi:MAG: hypothetical protein RL071_4136, partial [Pseudomonadota bacterium]